MAPHETTPGVCKDLIPKEFNSSGIVSLAASSSHQCSGKIHQELGKSGSGGHRGRQEIHGNGSMGMVLWEWFHGMERCWWQCPTAHTSLGLLWGGICPLCPLRSSQTLQCFPGNAQVVKEARRVCEAGRIHSWGEGRGRDTRIARGIQEHPEGAGGL